MLVITLGVSHNKNIVHKAHQNSFLEKKRAQSEKALGAFTDERVHLHFDKSFYKPGEDIWFQAYLVNEVDLTPSEISDFVNVELVNPKGAVEKKIKLLVKDGAASGDFHLDEQKPGGMYKVRAFSQWQKNDTSNLLFEKELQVQSVVLPRIKMKLDFDKKSYGQGETVLADVKIERNDNSPLSFHKLSYNVRIAGKVVEASELHTERNGTAKISYRLPEDMDQSDVLLNVMFEFEGASESISRAIPIASKHIKLSFYPEGGELAMGLTNNVAFAATNKKGKGIDVTGYIVNEEGRKMASFQSFYNGMGSFALKPDKATEYRAIVTSPEGIAGHFELPKAVVNGVALQVSTATQNNFELNLESPVDQELSIVGMTRGKVYYTGAIKARKGGNTLSIAQNEFPMGICRFTVFNTQGTALSERLAFANYHPGLNLNIRTSKEKYAPREKVVVYLEASDKDGSPIECNLSVSVVDDQLLSFAADKQSNILGKLLLEPELRGKVKDAGFYFDGTEDRAEGALDYLLLTRGWRKFSWKRISGQEQVSITNLPEKAIFGAQLMDRWTSSPIEGALAHMAGTNEKVVTDKDGNFKFVDVDLTKGPVNVVFKKEGYDSLVISANTYSTSQRFYMTDPLKAQKYYSRFNLDFEILEVDEDMVENEAPMAEDMLIANNEIPMELERRAFQVVQKNKAVAKAENGKLIEKEDKDNGFMREPVMMNAMDSIVFGDAFGKKNLWFDKNINPIYRQEYVLYQAREFPTRTYDPNEVVSQRTDFNTTVFWKGNVQTDAGGKAELSFYNNDKISSFNIVAEGIGAKGQLFHSSHKYYTQLPFNMDVKIPVTASFGDVVEIPLTLKNNTQNVLKGQLKVTYGDGLVAIESLPEELVVKAFEASTMYLPFRVADRPGKTVLSVSFTGEGVHDAFQKQILISPKGFPQQLSFSGQELYDKFQFEITSPIKGSVKANFKAYPNLLDEMLAGIESILREPSGCFEQTSSSTYPNIMVMQYLREAGKSDREVESKALGLIDRGYKRLTSYETSEKGYEWFGSAPSHEALTAYGLMEFIDMQQVYGKVDRNMLERTKKYLLDKRDGKGGFLRNSKALDRFGRASQTITNAYIVWALTEAGVKAVDVEFKNGLLHSLQKKDGYELSLMALSAFNLGKKEEASKLLVKLEDLQQKDGSFSGEESITKSGGVALAIETTSLAVLSMLKAEKPNREAIMQGIDFILNNRSFGGYGSTQSTVLALKALTAFAKASKRTKSPGSIELFIDGKLARELDYEAGRTGEIVFEGLEAYLSAGHHRVDVRFKGTESALPYALDLEWNSTLPASAANCQVALETQLNEVEMGVGELVRLKTTLTNTRKEGLPMAMVKIGIPGGLSAQAWQLKELKENGVIDFYETSPDYVICYFRDMAPSETLEILLDLKAEIPGSYESPASSAYLYYTDEYKCWKKTDNIQINP